MKTISVNTSIAIIGGSGGLGTPICKRLARDERPILIGYGSSVAKAEELATELSGQSSGVAIQAVDVRSVDSVEAFLATADAMGEGLGGVVNAVGPAIPLKSLTEISSEVFREIMETDVFGAFNVLTCASRRLKEKGGGAVVQLLTTAVLRTLENDGMSGIPKTAIMGIVRQLARDVGKDNIRVNGVAPGVIDAGIVHSSFAIDEVAQSVIEMCLDRTPMPRLGKPEEVAGLVAYLLSDTAGYINGQIIGVDGGYSA